MNRVDAIALALALALGTAACNDETPSGKPAGERRTDLAQGLLAWAQASTTAPADVRADVAVALGEVASIDHAHRLRLLAADDANPFHDAAGVALARLRAARDADPLAALDDCAQRETLPPVRLGCLVILRSRAIDRYVALVTPWLVAPQKRALACASITAASTPSGAWRNAVLSSIEALPEPDKSLPEVVRAREQLLAPAPLVPPADVDAALTALATTDPESLRSAVRALLLVPDTFRDDKRVETALLLATRQPDERLQHLVEAVFLRRTLADAAAKAPPPGHR